MLIELRGAKQELRLLIYILQYLKGPGLLEFWYIPFYEQCRIYIISRRYRLGVFSLIV